MLPQTRGDLFSRGSSGPGANLPKHVRNLQYVFQAMDSPLYTIPVLLFERNNTSRPSITLSYARIEEREYETYKYPDTGPYRVSFYRSFHCRAWIPQWIPTWTLSPIHEIDRRIRKATNFPRRPTPRARNHPKRIRSGKSRAIMPVLLGSDMSSLGATLLRGPWPSPSTLQASALWSDQTTVIYAIRRMG